jgi:hypothetical protein
MRCLSRLLALALWVGTGLGVTIADGATAGELLTAANGVTYPDAVGDSGLAPDIETIRVENDDSGLIIIQVRFRARLQVEATDFVGVFVNSDRDPNTGSETGAEWALALSGSGGALLCRVAPSIDCAVPQGAFRAAYTPEAATFTLNRGDIEVADGFDFWVGTSAPRVDDPSMRDFDFAPEGAALFPYDVLISPPCIVPNVKKKTLLASRSALAKANCTLGRITRRVSATVAKGRVISSRPRAGTRLPNKGKVDLVVSKGRKR